MRFPYLVLALTLCFLIAGAPTLGFAAAEADKPGSPEGGGQHDLDELARHLNNPVGPVWNIVTQNNWYFQKGFPSAAYRVQYVMNFQPVMPIPLTREWNLVFRPVIPLESTPTCAG